MDKDFTIHTIKFLDKDNNETIMYKGKVIFGLGYWKTSKEFSSYSEAFNWCMTAKDDAK